jgi:hypothetical protein
MSICVYLCSAVEKPLCPNLVCFDLDRLALDHAVSHFFAQTEPPKIVEEVIRQALHFVVTTASGVGRDITIWSGPQRMVRRQRLRFGHVEISGCEMS